MPTNLRYLKVLCCFQIPSQHSRPFAVWSLTCIPNLISKEVIPVHGVQLFLPPLHVLQSNHTLNYQSPNTNITRFQCPILLDVSFLTPSSPYVSRRLFSDIALCVSLCFLSDMASSGVIPLTAVNDVPSSPSLGLSTVWHSSPQLWAPQGIHLNRRKQLYETSSKYDYFKNKILCSGGICYMVTWKSLAVKACPDFPVVALTCLSLVFRIRQVKTLKNLKNVSKEWSGCHSLGSEEHEEALYSGFSPAVPRSSFGRQKG